MTFVTSDDVIIDCLGAVDGELIPQDVVGIERMATSAKAVLVVEKDATFQALIQEGFIQKLAGKILMVTGKGVPDLNTRQLVHRSVVRLF